jgi:transaldolase/glucose-6-phosphate isomerase
VKTVASELVDRIWARDPTVWTGGDEANWLGWLDEPARIQERLERLDLPSFEECVLLGMGGSSLAPEVMRRTFGAAAFRVLDTTHPAAVRRLEAELDLERTLFLVSSKSGSTLETRSHADYFFDRVRGRGEQFVAITDPGSELEQEAKRRGFSLVVHGEPTVGGRYSALSPFGMVPALVMGIDLERLGRAAEEMAEACRAPESPGLELGLALGEGWRAGRDKIVTSPNPGGFGLWVEQLLAESTGKEGKGLIPAPEDPSGKSDVQRHEVRIGAAHELGAEFFRWEFATAVAGSILGVNPFDQPNVQEAKDRTNAILDGGTDEELAPEGSLDDLLAGAGEGNYIAILAFVDPAEEDRLEPLVARGRETGCVVTKGRPEHRPLHPGRRRPRRRALDPGPALRFPAADPGAGCGRLCGIEGARPPRRARETGGHMRYLTFLGRRWQGRQAGGAQDSTCQCGQAPPARHPAASGVSLRRSAAPPRGSRRRRGT